MDTLVRISGMRLAVSGGVGVRCVVRGVERKDTAVPCNDHVIHGQVVKMVFFGVFCGSWESALLLQSRAVRGGLRCSALARAGDSAASGAAVSPASVAR